MSFIKEYGGVFAIAFALAIVVGSCGYSVHNQMQYADTRKCDSIQAWDDGGERITREDAEYAIRNCSFAHDPSRPYIGDLFHPEYR